jgi:hypothetical protein
VSCSAALFLYVLPSRGVMVKTKSTLFLVLAARTTGPYDKKHKTDSKTCFSVTPPLQARRHFAAGAARLLLIVAVLLLLLNLAALRCSRRLLLILQPGDVSCGVASLSEQEGGARLPRMDEDGPRRLRPTGPGSSGLGGEALVCSWEAFERHF